MRKLIIILFLLCACACSSIPTYHGIPNFALVAEDVYRGGQPDYEGWAYLYRIGVTTVVKLNTEQEGRDIEAEMMGIKVVRIPITFWEQMTGVERGKLQEAAAYLFLPHTFVHCSHGEDRTGLVVACHRLMQKDWTRENAEYEMYAYGFHRSLLGLWLDWEWAVKPTVSSSWVSHKSPAHRTHTSMFSS